MRRIEDVADELGLAGDDLELHGSVRAKIALTALDEPPTPHRRGKYVLVTAITPAADAPAGKTVTAIGLAMALRGTGARSAAALRQSSIGPTFGQKGGGAGGGRSSIVPLDVALLGLGGDMFAVETANNLLAAVVDDAIFRGADLDPASVTWRRVIDSEDRALRHLTVGRPGSDGPEITFDIAAASEVMGVLSMSRDIADLRARLGRVVPAWDRDGKAVTAEQLGAAGAMAASVIDSFRPNLMQTNDGTPVLIHAGPFGNIATGNSSVVADRIALPRTDYLVTEAGFGSDLGAEKFFHLKCASSGLEPDAAVLVATIPALRSHGGRPSEVPDPTAVEAGVANLRRHIQILQGFGIPVVVAVNRHPGDTDAEVELVSAAAREAGATSCAEHRLYAEGADGGRALADAVIDACEQSHALQRRYEPGDPLERKIEAIATSVYGAAGVSWSGAALAARDRLRDAGYDGLPVCIAKTHLSLSHDRSLVGAPEGFELPIQDLRLAAGAGYVTVYAGNIITMPGLPAQPRLLDIDIDASGTITGLE